MAQLEILSRIASSSNDIVCASAGTVEAWGLLRSIEPERPHIALEGFSYVIGRSIPRFKISTEVVSGKHFTIALNGKNVVLTDTSTNGTFINCSEESVGRGNKRIITHMNDISLVNPKRKENGVCNYTFIDPKLELREIEQGGPQTKYEIKEILGTGQFAQVRRVINRKTGKQYACKIIAKAEYVTNTSRNNALMDEVQILLKIKHENITGIEEIFETETYLYIILELVTGGELFDLVITGALPEKRARDITFQLLMALRYLHLVGIVHRDLKPENILLLNPPGNAQASDYNDIIRVSDFGLSRLINEESFMKTICGTPQYVAPEVLTSQTNGGYGSGVDMWAVGVILFIMLCGYPPFSDEDGQSALFNQIKTANFAFRSPWWDPISKEAKDLIKKLIVVDPKRRFSVHQALAHPFFGERAIPIPSSVELKRMQADLKGQLVVNEVSRVGKKRRTPSEAKDISMTSPQAKRTRVASSLVIASTPAQTQTASVVAETPSVTREMKKSVKGRNSANTKPTNRNIAVSNVKVKASPTTKQPASPLTLHGKNVNSPSTKNSIMNAIKKRMGIETLTRALSLKKK